MNSWHDYHLTGYSVDGKHKTLSFDVEWPYASVTEIRRAKLVFSGVEAYLLQHDLGVGIIYAIEEVSLQDHLHEWSDCFERECKWGWPIFWRQKPYPKRTVEVELEDALAFLNSKGIKCFELSSSYGLNGWVLASSVDTTPLPEPEQEGRPTDVH